MAERSVTREQSEAPLEQRGPRRAVKAAGRTLLWPLRRFFDPRFAGLAERLDVKHGDLVARFDPRFDAALAELAAVRRESQQHRAESQQHHAESAERYTESVKRHAESIQLARALADLIREADRFREAMRTGSVDDIDDEVARLLNYAASHRGFAAQRGLWFNPPLSLRYSKGDVVLEETHERIVEVGYAFGALAPLEAGATILDIGAAESALSFSLASLGYAVTALDVRPYPLAHPSLESVETSILEWEHSSRFDAVVCVSTIEHIGLGAYGDPATGDGSDHAAMRRIYELTEPGGLLVLTAPIGRAGVDELQRTYDQAGLMALLDGWRVEDLTVVRRQDRKTWILADEDGAGARGEAGVALVTARHE